MLLATSDEGNKISKNSWQDISVIMLLKQHYNVNIINIYSNQEIWYVCCDESELRTDCLFANSNTNYIVHTSKWPFTSNVFLNLLWFQFICAIDIKMI